MSEQTKANQARQERQIVWYKDTKLLFGVILVVISLVLGFFSKGIIIAKIYEPFYLITGLSIYAFSWLLLFAGILLVGVETVKMIRQHIHNYIKRSIMETYGFTKSLPRKGLHYTKHLHRKGLEKLGVRRKEEKKP